MKSITEIKALMANKNMLTPSQMFQVKGGDDNTPPAATEDDKRRERPGGGVSTQ